jgi:hypothetical protein
MGKQVRVRMGWYAKARYREKWIKKKNKEVGMLLRVKRMMTAGLLLIVLAGTAGCGTDFGSLLQMAKSPEAPLLRVHIQFTDQRETVCYVRSLGLEKDAQVYAGGPSSNNMYDQAGNIVGSYNYQHVIYIQILPEEGSGQL